MTTLPPRARWLPRTGTRDRTWVIGLLLFQATAALAQAWCVSPTNPEMIRLLGGYRRLEQGLHDFDPGNPPLFGNLAALVTLPWDPQVNWSRRSDSHWSASDFLLNNQRHIQPLLFTARLVPTLVLLWGTLVCRRWGTQLAGRRGGLLAATAWALSPLVLSQGAALHPDAMASVCALVACQAAWNAGRDPTCGGAVQAGLWLGLALATKFVAMVMVPLWIALMLGGGSLRLSGGRRATGWLCAIGAALFTLHAAGLFQGGMSTLSDWGQPSETGRVNETGRWWQQAPTLVPRDWARGFSEMFAVARPIADGNADRAQRGAWGASPRYYARLLTWRTPVGLCGLWLVGCAGLAWRARQRPARLLIPLTGAALCLAACGLVKPHYPRYALPASAWLAVLAAGAASVPGLRRGRTAAALWGTVALWTMTQLAVWIPWQWGYRGELAWLRDRDDPVLKFQVDDEGHDIGAALRWERGSGGRAPVYFALPGFDPRELGSAMLPLGSHPLLDPAAPPGGPVPPCTLCVSDLILREGTRPTEFARGIPFRQKALLARLVEQRNSSRPLGASLRLFELTSQQQRDWNLPTAPP